MLYLFIDCLIWQWLEVFLFSLRIIRPFFEAVSNQTVFNIEKVEVSLFGFFFPESLSGVDFAGYPEHCFFNIVPIIMSILKIWRNFQYTHKYKNLIHTT